MYNLTVLLIEIALANLFQQIAYAVKSLTTTTVQGFFIEPIGVTKCLHNYLYYITSPRVHDVNSLLIQPKSQGHACVCSKCLQFNITVDVTISNFRISQQM